MSHRYRSHSETRVPRLHNEALPRLRACCRFDSCRGHNVVFLNFTSVAPVKLVPVMITEVPTGPLIGTKDVIVGAGTVVTVKFPALVAVPSGVVTLIFASPANDRLGRAVEVYALAVSDKTSSSVRRAFATPAGLVWR